MTTPPTAPSTARKLTRKDFMSDQEVRWCPGCGDYAILATIQRILPDLGVAPENFVFISGIGCSSRFPYYMNTYGFHTIHGRAPAIATGVKLANPELSVWVTTGDGDGLSIGGNHIIHAVRRNPNLNILLFNNRIYGLTKGQFSPTSELGKNTKSSPWGNIDHPLNPLALVLGAGATFVARTIDRDPSHMAKVLKAAHEHEGTSFVEILQNCNIFNNGAFLDLTERDRRAENQLRLVEGKPLVFGANQDKGIRVSSDGNPEILHLESEDVSEDDLAVHDPTRPSAAYATMLAHLDLPSFPLPIGVLRRVEQPTYESLLHDQIARARAVAGPGDLKSLIQGTEVWQVE